MHSSFRKPLTFLKVQLLTPNSWTLVGAVPCPAAWKGLDVVSVLSCPDENTATVRRIKIVWSADIVDPRKYFTFGSKSSES